MTWDGLPSSCPMDDNCAYYWDGYCEGAGKGSDCIHKGGSNEHALCPRGKGSEHIVGLFSFVDINGIKRFCLGGIREAELYLYDDKVETKFNYCPFCGEELKFDWSTWD